MPIVSPTLIYLCNLCGVLHILTGIIAFILLSVAVILSATTLAENGNNLFISTPKAVDQRKLAKKFFIAAIVNLILFALLPSEEVAYTLLLSSYLTPNNIAEAGNQITNLIDYLAETIKAICSAAS